ncbi:prepilin peptidase [Patescibacteria group bacterium]|nr:prepilin peptidase [Patescibacteria group bacterium]MBU1868546.1 prepilin peptidase [Patescibacteria group bacterium]
MRDGQRGFWRNWRQAGIKGLLAGADDADFCKANMEIIIYIFIFIFGTAVGSFINAFEYRLYRSKQIIRGRSQCPHCQHLLAWYDLIPLFSFVLLWGKCRYCGREISLQYPLMELVTGMFLVLAVLLAFEFRVPGSALPTANYQLPITIYQLLFTFFVIAALEIIFIYDLKYGLIPDEVILITSVASLLYRLSTFVLPVTGYTFRVTNDLIFPLLSGLGAALFFIFLIILTKGRGMGGGDVKLVFLMGLIMGFPQIVFALYLAFLSGALISVILILLNKKEFGQTIPFGPFLVGATLIVFLC